MRHLRADYNAIQPWPVKREHHVKLDGALAMDVHPTAAEINPRVEPLIPDDEPVFLLRGQDPCAVAALDAYIEAYEDDPAHDPEMSRALRRWANEMERWAIDKDHGLPDVPDGLLG